MMPGVEQAARNGEGIPGGRKGVEAGMLRACWGRVRRPARLVRRGEEAGKTG